MTSISPSYNPSTSWHWYRLVWGQETMRKILMLCLFHLFYYNTYKNTLKKIKKNSFWCSEPIHTLHLCLQTHLQHFYSQMYSYMKTSKKSRVSSPGLGMWKGTQVTNNKQRDITCKHVEREYYQTYLFALKWCCCSIKCKNVQ